MSSQDFSDEEKYCDEFLKDYYHLREDSGVDKFRILSKLVTDLFKNKNSRACYETISNLIIVTLSTVNNKAVDVFSCREEPEIRQDKIFKKILKKEVKDAVKEYQMAMSVGRDFLEVVSRFSNQYERVDNVEFCPKIRKYEEELLN